MRFDYKFEDTYDIIWLNSMKPKISRMDQPLSTADVPRQFLKAAFLIGHIPLKALASDPRISYTLYIPPERYDSSINPTKLPLLVWIHGTGRQWNALYEEEVISFANTTPCAILAPVFPAGLDSPNDIDSYKKLKSRSLRSDLALLSILDEVSLRWGGIRTDKFFMNGFSGGGQFVHRFLYLYPERLEAVSVGAPGSVTVLDKGQKWPAGIGDVQVLFEKLVDTECIRGVTIQLVVGSEDNQVHGGKEFWTWLQEVKNKVGSYQQNRSVATIELGRLQILQDLQRSWTQEGIDSRLDVIEGISHEAKRAQGHMLSFLGPLIQTAFQNGS